MQKAISAARIFTGQEFLHDHAIIIENDTINALCPRSQVPNDMPVEDKGNVLLAPAFVDAQVYGAGGRLFSVYRDTATLSLMHELFQKDGTAFFLPTVATNTIEVMHDCINAVRQYWKEGGKGVAGLHLEGPWLHPVRRGAHVEAWIHAPSVHEVKELLEAGRGVIRMITIAPEVCSSEVMELLRKEGIILSAGHSNATRAQADEGFSSGISTVTHLYNAMSPLHHREPGLVGAAFLHGRVMASIIPDGYHVDFAAVALAKKIMGPRLFAITDAVTETSEGPYQHYRAGDYYESNGILSGSALSMKQAFLNLVHKVGIDEGEALRMCSTYPAQVIGISDRYGSFEKGKSADHCMIENT